MKNERRTNNKQRTNDEQSAEQTAEQLAAYDIGTIINNNPNIINLFHVFYDYKKYNFDFIEKFDNFENSLDKKNK